MSRPARVPPLARPPAPVCAGAARDRALAPWPQGSSGTRRLRRAAAVSAGLMLALGALSVAADRWVRLSTASLIYTDLQAVPPRPVGIVFGALVHPRGTLSPVLCFPMNETAGSSQGKFVHFFIFLGTGGGAAGRIMQ